MDKMPYNPYASIDGETLSRSYQDLFNRKQQIEYQLYYLGAELQRRMNQIRDYGPNSMPDNMIPTISFDTVVPNQQNPAEGPQLIINEVKQNTNDGNITKSVLPFSSGASAQQKAVDETVKKYLKS